MYISIKFKCVYIDGNNELNLVQNGPIQRDRWNVFNIQSFFKSNQLSINYTQMGCGDEVNTFLLLVYLYRIRLCLDWQK